jgi:hypothetical protein
MGYLSGYGLMENGKPKTLLIKYFICTLKELIFLR